MSDTVQPDAEMAARDTSTTQKLFTIHGWSGVILGLLLYAVIVTGTAAVFHDEIGNWSSPLPQAPTTAFQPGLDAAIKAAASDVDPRYLDEVFVASATAHRVSAFFHTHVHPEDGAPFEEGVRFSFDPSTWEQLDRQEITGPEVEGGNRPGALARFLVDLHVRLYLPNPWGLLLTGVLGLAMMVAAVTGVVIHRQMIRDLFLQRLSRKNRVLSARDRHVAAGTWNLVFTFLLAFTGSFFSFAGSFGLPVMAMVASGGDQEKLFEMVIGLPEAHDDSPAPVADLDALLVDARSRSTGEGSQPQFLVVSRWGQADGFAMVTMSPPAGDLKVNTLMYQADSGEFMRAKPNIGLQPSLGDDVLSLIGPLHFGNFAGLFSKAVWFGLGFASSYVVLTGLLLWTQRREHHRGWQRLRRLSVWMGYGLLFALAATPVGFFSAEWLGFAQDYAVKLAFVLGVVIASLMMLVIRDMAQLTQALVAGFAGLLIVAVALRWFSGGMGWLAAARAGWPEIPAVDLLFLATGGGIIVWQAYRSVNQPQLAPAGQNQ